MFTSAKKGTGALKFMEEQIERTREQMKQLVEELGFLHPDVVRCSEHLDELLLDYYAFMRKKKE